MASKSGQEESVFKQLASLCSTVDSQVASLKNPKRSNPREYDANMAELKSDINQMKEESKKIHAKLSTGEQFKAMMKNITELALQQASQVNRIQNYLTKFGYEKPDFGEMPNLKIEDWDDHEEKQGNSREELESRHSSTPISSNLRPPNFIVPTPKPSSPDAVRKWLQDVEAESSLLVVSYAAEDSFGNKTLQDKTLEERKRLNLCAKKKKLGENVTKTPKLFAKSECDKFYTPMASNSRADGVTFLVPKSLANDLKTPDHGEDSKIPPESFSQTPEFPVLSGAVDDFLKQAKINSITPEEPTLSGITNLFGSNKDTANARNKINEDFSEEPILSTASKYDINADETDTPTYPLLSGVGVENADETVTPTYPLLSGVGVEIKVDKLEDVDTPEEPVLSGYTSALNSNRDVLNTPQMPVLSGVVEKMQKDMKFENYILNPRKNNEVGEMSTPEMLNCSKLKNIGINTLERCARKQDSILGDSMINSRAENSTVSRLDFSEDGEENLSKILESENVLTEVTKDVVNSVREETPRNEYPKSFKRMKVTFKNTPEEMSD